MSKTLIINCDDFERRPTHEVEDYDNDEELKARIKVIERIMAENKFSYFRGYRIVKDV